MNSTGLTKSASTKLVMKPFKRRAYLNRDIRPNVGVACRLSSGLRGGMVNMEELSDDATLDP